MAAILHTTFKIIFLNEILVYFKFHQSLFLSIDSDNGLAPKGAKPLSEEMMT